jgi:putative component of membrane protein insertase Oxa1/YidC/SpoIIIJ protein YidD
MTAIITHTTDTNKTPLLTLDGIYKYKRYFSRDIVCCISYDNIAPRNVKPSMRNSVTIDATVAGINPFHAGGIDPNTTDMSVMKKTNKNTPLNV